MMVWQLFSDSEVLQCPTRRLTVVFSSNKFFFIVNSHYVLNISFTIFFPFVTGLHCIQGKRNFSVSKSEFLWPSRRDFPVWSPIYSVSMRLRTFYYRFRRLEPRFELWTGPINALAVSFDPPSEAERLNTGFISSRCQKMSLS
jgi:hypothetical protein